MPNAIFISHSSRDTDFVENLRQALDAKGFYHLVDSRELRGRDTPLQTIYQAIETARAFIVVVSPDAFNSAWVAEETRYASQVKERRRNGFAMIPLLREGVEMGALKWLFSRKATAIRVLQGGAGIRRAMPQILAALGEREPADPGACLPAPGSPREELLLEVRFPSLQGGGGAVRAVGTAELTYISAAGGPREASREPFLFTSPMDPEEMAELTWYLEQYCRWPTAAFKARAKGVEERIPDWGRALFRNAMPEDSCARVLEAWRGAERAPERRFTVTVDPGSGRGGPGGGRAKAGRAALLLLSLPWELVHDGDGYLFRGARPVRTQRHPDIDAPPSGAGPRPPVKVLMIGPRSEGSPAPPGAAAPMAEPLCRGEGGAEVSLLSGATLSEVEGELVRAGAARSAYRVLHFDGRGEDHQRGRTGLRENLAEELARITRDHRVALFFSRSLMLGSD